MYLIKLTFTLKNVYIYIFNRIFSLVQMLFQIKYLSKNILFFGVKLLRVLESEGKQVVKKC